MNFYHWLGIESDTYPYKIKATFDSIRLRADDTLKLSLETTMPVDVIVTGVELICEPWDTPVILN